jgi:hypothetical protein
MTRWRIPSGSGSLGISLMNTYSIVRIGGEYVVQADHKSVLKIASRRKAARLISDAAELLDSLAAPPLSRQAEPSTARDLGDIADPHKVP